MNSLQVFKLTLIQLVFLSCLFNFVHLASSDAKPTMAEPVLGKFVLKHSENFDAFLKEIGLGWVKRAAASIASATLYISKKGNVYTMYTDSTFGKSKIEFELNKEFEEDRMDGVRVKSIITLDGNKMTHIQKAEGKPDVTLIRVFNDSGMNLEASTNKVLAKRHYVRQ
jgi:hypothetical protein